MATLEDELFLRELSDYGYQLASPSSNSATAKRVLLKMLSSTDGRVLEGVPVVLTNVLVQKNFDLEAFERELEKGLQKRFRLLSAVTLLFSFLAPDGDKVQERLYEYLENREPGLFENVRSKLRDGKLNVGGGLSLDATRLEKTYQNYVVTKFRENEESLSRRLEHKRNNAFLGALKELFTDKQVDLMFKVLRQEDMSKTDREYYSRTVKPRLRALKNEELQSMATVLLQ